MRAAPIQTVEQIESKWRKETQCSYTRRDSLLLLVAMTSLLGFIRWLMRAEPCRSIMNQFGKPWATSPSLHIFFHVCWIFYPCKSVLKFCKEYSIQSCMYEISWKRLCVCVSVKLSLQSTHNAAFTSHCVTTP